MEYVALIAAVLALVAGGLIGLLAYQKAAKAVTFAKLKKYLAENYHNDDDLAENYVSRDEANTYVTHEAVNAKIEAKIAAHTPGGDLATRQELEAVDTKIETFLQSATDLPSGTEIEAKIAAAVAGLPKVIGPSVTVDHDTERRAKCMEEAVNALLSEQRTLLTTVTGVLRAPLEREIAEIEAEKVKKTEGRGELVKAKREADKARSEAESRFRELSRKRLPKEPTEAMIEAHVESLNLSSYKEKMEAADRYTENYAFSRIEHSEKVDQAEQTFKEADTAFEEASAALTAFDRDRVDPEAEARLKKLRAQIAGLSGLDRGLDQVEDLLKRPLRSLPPPPAPPKRFLSSSPPVNTDGEVHQVTEEELKDDEPSSFDLSSLPPPADVPAEGLFGPILRHCKCGRGNPQDAKFCANCGAKIKGGTVVKDD